MIGGVEFDRPDSRPDGLLDLNPRHIEESNRGHVALPGGGFFAWASFQGRDASHQPPRVSGGVYTPSLSPFDDHPDACTVSSDFDLGRTPGTVGVLVDMPDPRDRDYGWWVKRAIEDSMTEEFLESSAPESIESDDGQAGLNDFNGKVEPCPPEDIRSCDCCRCIHCGSIATRARVTKTPMYACGNPSCNGEPFDEPDVFPGRR